MTRSLTLVALAAAFAFHGCAVEDFGQPIPDQTITGIEIAEGDRAVQSIPTGGTDPAFDMGQADEQTDGETEGLAPDQSEPSETQQDQDLALLEAEDDGAGEELVEGPPPTSTEEYEDEGPTVSDGTGTTVEGVTSCRRASGYIRGKRYTVCVTTVNGKLVATRTATAFVRMRAAARRVGVRIRVVSGFRTIARQRYLYNCYRTKRCNNGNLAARPGYSNHQSGLALDLNTVGPGVYNWLSRNARRFGFRRTVPSERWHWEYRP